MEYRQNEQLLLAQEFVQSTNRNIFLTGKAGTGKTTFLHNLKRITPKRMVVVAPTGVAAINAGGVTIHSFFQLSFAPAVPGAFSAPAGKPGSEGFQRRFSREKIRLIKCIDLLVIDEISMVRADVLDAVDEVLRKYRHRHLAFGGVQLLMIGDLHQLSPVIRDEEWNILRAHYNSVFFFDSRALKKTDPVTIQLTEIFRQEDAGFIALLNKVRDNSMDEAALQTINSRYMPEFRAGKDEGFIILTTHNRNAFDMNQTRLIEIPGDAMSFSAEIEGEFPAQNFPTEETLLLKPGAQVMFIKNDLSGERQYYNGKIGIVTRLKDNTVFVKCQSDEAEIAVGRVTWENIKYALQDGTNEIKETMVGSFTQVPLKLAWAITIHKSQGLTFDKVIIDANAAFASGQVYVALSRCRTFEGIILSTPVSQAGIKTDVQVMQYSRDARQNEPGPEQLFDSKRSFQQALIFELFDFKLIRFGLDHLLKLSVEHSTIIDPGIIEEVRSLIQQCDPAIFQVADKFRRQMEDFAVPLLLPEANQKLQERIRLASEYFAVNIKSNISPALEKLKIESDNTAVRKLLIESLEKLLKEVFVRNSCLEACRHGFETIAYLRIRADADVGFRPPSSPKTNSTRSSSSASQHPDLYSELRRWRHNLSEELNIPAYMILPQKSLIELPGRLPTRLSELKLVKGIGPARIKRFGKDIISIVLEYCIDHDILPDENEEMADQLKKR